MKRIIIVIILIGVIYILGQITFDQVQIYLNKASLILSSINVQKIEAAVISKYSESDFTNGAELTHSELKVEIINEYINEDDIKDLVVVIKSPSTCGSGGCLTTIYLLNEQNELKPINFEFVVKSIKVQPSMTNNMHDILINDDVENIMTWDGFRYTLNTL